MRFLSFFLLGFLCLGLFSCGEVTDIIDDTEETGYLNFYSDVDSVDRIQITEQGEFVTANFKILYNPAPEGAHDGDNGVDMYLRFQTDPTQLKVGDSIPFSDAKISVWIAEWASPAGYDTYSDAQLSGSIQVLETNLPRSMRLLVDVTYTSHDRTIHYQKNIKLKPASPWVNLPKELKPDWNSWDSTASMPLDSISKSKLEGRWEAHTGVQDQNGQVMELIWSPGVYWLVVKEGRMKTSDWETFHEFDVEGRQVTGPEPGMINLIDENRLVLTWKNGEQHIRRDYFRK